MDTLPNEMLFEIAKYLEYTDFKTLRYVSPISKEIAEELIRNRLNLKFYEASPKRLADFCSTFSEPKRTNFVFKFNSFSFGSRLLRNHAAFSPVSTFCQKFSNNVTKLDLNLLYPCFTNRHLEYQVFIKALGLLLTSVSDTVKELRLEHYKDLNGLFQKMPTFHSLEILELRHGFIVLLPQAYVENADAENLVISISKRIPRIRRVCITEIVGGERWPAGNVDPTMFLAVLKNIAAINPNTVFSFWLSFLRMPDPVEGATLTRLFEGLSLSSLKVNKLRLWNKNCQQFVPDSLRMLLLWISKLTTLGFLQLFGFHEARYVGPFPQLRNLRELDYFQGQRNSVFPVRVSSDFPYLTTVKTSYFCNDFLVEIPSVKILILTDGNGYPRPNWNRDAQGHLASTDSIYENGMKTWGDRLARAFPNINYLSCDTCCIGYEFIFKFRELKTLVLGSPAGNLETVRLETEKAKGNHFWNLLTGGYNDLTFDQIRELTPEALGVDSPRPPPLFRDLKHLEILKITSLNPGTGLIKALIFLSQMKQIPRLKKLLIHVIKVKVQDIIQGFFPQEEIDKSCWNCFKQFHESTKIAYLSLDYS